MASNYTLISCIICLLALGCTAPPDKDLATIFNEIDNEVSQNSKAYETLEESIETIGHRLTGSENGRKAEEFTSNLFRSYGFENVRFQQFEMKAWMRDTVSLSISGEDYTIAVPTVTLAHSTLQANISARIIDVGNGLYKDFEQKKESVAGKIVLMNIGIYPKDSTLRNLHRSEKTSLAIQYNAVGVIIINNKEGGVLLTGTASVTGEVIPIPAISIGLENGVMLKEKLLTEQLTGNIQMTNTSKYIVARNVIATLEGSELPDEVIIIGGHLDSWDLASGAIDNGIGTFSIIDIARTFITLGLNPKRTIQFVMFMGEEQGLFGSSYMENSMAQDGTIDGLKYMINLDMAGNTSGYNTFGRDEIVSMIDSIGDIIATIDTSFENNNSNHPWLHSDHQPFLLSGIPIIGHNGNLGAKVYKYYHSNGDHFSLVNKAHMLRCVKITAMMLYALADANTIPSKRWNDDAIKDFLIHHKMKEKLVIGKDWRWSD